MDCTRDSKTISLNVENLKECFGMLKQGKAAGIDGISVEAYGQNLVCGQVKERVFQARTQD